jgi:hypothetical protein
MERGRPGVKFKVKDWVRSVRRGSKGSFIGQIVDTIDGEYIVRDTERRRWLRKASELQPAKKEAA